MKPILLENIDDLTNDLIKALVNKHKIEAVPRFEKLERYYLGKHDILNRVLKDVNKPNNKVVNPYASYITDMIQGYFMGKPVTYTSNDDSFLENIGQIYDKNDEQSHNSLLSKDMSIYGIAFELIYIDEYNNIKFSKLPVLETFMIYDTSIDPKAIAAIRYYTVENYVDSSKVTKVQVYTDQLISHYTLTNDEMELEDEYEHFFGGVPVNPVFNNDEEIGDFEKVISNIDAYDKAVSDQVNDMEYMADSYIHIATGGGEDDEPLDPSTFQDMKNSRIIMTDANGKVSFVTRQTDNATVESYKTRLQKDIHKFAHVPDLSQDEFGGSNISGIALAYKFQGLEQIAANKERLFKQALSNRLRMIVNILNIKGNNYDAESLMPLFTRNLPVNITEHIQIAKDLTGIVSKETILAQLPFISNVKDEMDKIEEEKNEGANDYADVFNNESVIAFPQEG